MRIFKTKVFNSWAKKVNLSDISLQKAITEIAVGQYDASLGGSLYKKRIAINNRGKSNGYRVIIAIKHADKAFFIHGFAKNCKPNITNEENYALRDLANIYLSYNDKQIQIALDNQKFIEVLNNE